jgi:hypothetical protein
LCRKFEFELTFFGHRFPLLKPTFPTSSRCATSAHPNPVIEQLLRVCAGFSTANIALLLAKWIFGRLAH